MLLSLVVVPSTSSSSPTTLSSHGFALVHPGMSDVRFTVQLHSLYIAEVLFDNFWSGIPLYIAD